MILLPHLRNGEKASWLKVGGSSGPLSLWFGDPEVNLGGAFKQHLCSPRTLGKIPILTNILKNWVETTN